MVKVFHCLSVSLTRIQQNPSCMNACVVFIITLSGKKMREGASEGGERKKGREQEIKKERRDKRGVRQSQKHKKRRARQERI